MAKECRKAIAASRSWPTSGPRWVVNKLHLHGGAQERSRDSGGTHAHCSSPGKDAEQVEQPVEDSVGRFAETDVMHCRFRPQRDIRRDKTLLQHNALNAGPTSLHGDPVQSTKISSTVGELNASGAAGAEKFPPKESCSSQLPLRLLIKVSGQRGGLGISIAGGKGSLPYKEHDEGVFISRVTKGGPSEKAGVHVGDRVLEVDGLSMQGATHQEAVSALRNAGSCIKMKVLRERRMLRDSPVAAVNKETEAPLGGQSCNQEVGSLTSKPSTAGRAVDCLHKKIEALVCNKKIQAIVCNGNGISDLEGGPNWTSREQAGPRDSTKISSHQAGKHTISIPRIILTHPSISDDEAESEAQCPEGDDALEDFGVPDDPLVSDCFSTAFYPP